MHPVTGAVAAIDKMLNSGMPSVSAAPYSNNFPCTTTTTLFDIDCSSDKLFVQNPPNDGVLIEIGASELTLTQTTGSISEAPAIAPMASSQAGEP
ncbi:MAG: DUF4394 domain-containing protein [Chryseolinea sp.]